MYCVYVQTEFPCIFVKVTQKQAQHVKWLALYQDGIHVTPFSVVIEISKEHAQLCLCPDYACYSLLLFLFFFLVFIIMQNTMHNFAEAKTSHSIKTAPI